MCSTLDLCNFEINATSSVQYSNNIQSYYFEVIIINTKMLIVLAVIVLVIN